MSKFVFRENNFDLIRLLAASQVVITHGLHHFGYPMDSLLFQTLALFPGVPIFFVISGFLISASYERSSSFSSYTKNRVLRIFPALWACFFVALITVFAVYSTHFPWAEFGFWVIAQLSVGQFYNPEFMRDYGTGVLNGSLWTIPVELQFYFFLPVLYLLFNRIRWSLPFIFMLGMALVLVNQVYINWLLGQELLLAKLFGVTLLPYLYMFLAGTMLQRHQAAIARWLHGKVFWWLLLYLGVTWLAGLQGWRTGGNYLNPVSALLLSMLTIAAGYTGTKYFSNVLRGNDISYGVYIYHMIFVNLLLYIAQFSMLQNMIIMIALTYTCALLSWHLIERPAMKLKNYSIARR